MMGSGALSPGPLTPLERRFAALVASAGATADPTGVMAAAAAEVMRATVEGHACLTLPSLVDRLTARTFPVTTASLLGAARGHPWVHASNGAAPLVLEHDRLYLRRHREAERRLARALLARAGGPPLDGYPADQDRQEVAVRQALASRLTIVTGGPGTGKTSTVARLLRALEDEAPGARVALAAPTGKAATRLGEAIAAAQERLGGFAAHSRISVVPQTLHRLLGYLPMEDRFKRNAADPLEHDVVVVDECSMVSLGLMDALFEAIRPEARVILLGDHGQLASVETGAVLADIVDAARGGPLTPNVVQLVRSHRFAPDRGIGALARAVREGDVAAMHRVLADAGPAVSRGPSAPEATEWIEEYAAMMRPVFDEAIPAAAFGHLARARILCATNVGPSGTDAVVRRVEGALARAGVPTRGTHYHGRPLLITRNDYGLQLFNGDTGIVWCDALDGSGGSRAYISTGGEGSELRSCPLPQLPDARTAWAMSIHRSQGSEFDEVLVVLPDRDLPILNRELIYTAITRARSRITIIGPDTVLEAAVARTTRRESGLAVRLAEPL